MLKCYRVGYPSDSDERGSLIVVLAIILVLVLISSALVAEVAGNQQNVVARQNSASSTAAANGGLADALFRLDQGSTDEGNGTEFYVSSGSYCNGDSRCVATTVPGVNGVSYVARQSSATKWTIQSKGIVGGSTTAVQETLNRSALYPFALFGNTGLTFNGNASNAFGAYTTSQLSSGANPDTNASDCTSGTGTSCVAIGSNGTISCGGGAGGLSSNVTSVYYTGGGGISGNCGTGSPSTSLYQLTIPTQPSTFLPCPNGGQLGSNQTVTGTVPGVNAALPAGTYLCTDQEVVINGNLAVSGAVTLDILLDSTTNNSFVNSGTATLDITAGSYVNVSTAINSDPPPANVSLPDATLLTINSNSSGTIGDSNGHGYYFGGVLYAPDASLTGDGCKSIYYGAAVISILTCNGGPHLSVYYDNLLSGVYGPWGTSGYTQINPSSMSIP